MESDPDVRKHCAECENLAERQAGKRASGKRPNGVVVGDRFLADQNRQALPVAQRVVIQSLVISSCRHVSALPPSFPLT